jgi:predicted nucleic acid-binding protein
MNAVFLDTGYLLALELSNDTNHEAAVQHWQTVSRTLPLLVTTSYVFDEATTFFNSRGFHSKAVQVGNNLLNSPSVELVHVDEPLFSAGWAYFQQHQDKQYSLTDCISFVLMKQRGIQAAFTFDRHFAQAGFAKQP